MAAAPKKKVIFTCKFRVKYKILLSGAVCRIFVQFPDAVDLLLIELHVPTEINFTHFCWQESYFIVSFTTFPNLYDLSFFRSKRLILYIRDCFCCFWNIWVQMLCKKKDYDIKRMIVSWV